MKKLELMVKNEKETRYVFDCPGCGFPHWVRTAGDRPRWKWNGSLEAPTFSPSILVNPDNPKARCHSFVRDGKIQFLQDCHHKLAGRTVDLPDMESA